MIQRDAVARRYVAVGWIYLPIATLAVHLIGSTVLGVVTSGAAGFVGAPFLAVFGVFFLPIEFVAVAAQWYLYSAYSFSKRAFWVLFTISIALVPAVAAALGPKEEGSEFLWAIGFGLGAAVAGVSTLLVLRLIVKVIRKGLGHKDAGRL